jgi:hypothetical protein
LINHPNNFSNQQVHLQQALNTTNRVQSNLLNGTSINTAKNTTNQLQTEPLNLPASNSTSQRLLTPPVLNISDSRRSLRIQEKQNQRK